MKIIIGTILKKWRMRNYASITLCAIMFAVVSGCTSYSDYGSGSSGFPVRGGGANFADGSFLGTQLSRGDKQALSEAFLGAMNTLDTDVRNPWQNDRNRGLVIAGSFYIANLLPNPDDKIPARGDLDLSYSLETEQGAYVLAKNSNVRRGPSTDYEILKTIPSGTAVDGIGRVEGEPWMLMATKARVHGYVYESLMVKAPGTDAFELAGGPVRTPVLCRDFTQTIDVQGQRDQWDGTVCDYGRGWVLEKQTGPTRLGY